MTTARSVTSAGYGTFAPEDSPFAHVFVDVTPEGTVAPFFEHVIENEGNY